MMTPHPTHRWYISIFLQHNANRADAQATQQLLQLAYTHTHCAPAVFDWLLKAVPSPAQSLTDGTTSVLPGWITAEAIYTALQLVWSSLSEAEAETFPEAIQLAHWRVFRRMFLNFAVDNGSIQLAAVETGSQPVPAMTSDLWLAPAPPANRRRVRHKASHYAAGQSEAEAADTMENSLEVTDATRGLSQIEHVDWLWKLVRSHAGRVYAKQAQTMLFSLAASVHSPENSELDPVSAFCVHALLPTSTPDEGPAEGRPRPGDQPPEEYILELWRRYLEFLRAQPSAAAAPATAEAAAPAPKPAPAPAPTPAPAARLGKGESWVTITFANPQAVKDLGRSGAAERLALRINPEMGEVRTALAELLQIPATAIALIAPASGAELSADLDFLSLNELGVFGAMRAEILGDPTLLQAPAEAAGQDQGGVSMFEQAPADGAQGEGKVDGGKAGAGGAWDGSAAGLWRWADSSRKGGAYGAACRAIQSNQAVVALLWQLLQEGVGDHTADEQRRVALYSIIRHLQPAMLTRAGTAARGVADWLEVAHTAAASGQTWQVLYALQRAEEAATARDGRGFGGESVFQLRPAAEVLEALLADQMVAAARLAERAPVLVHVQVACIALVTRVMVCACHILPAADTSPRDILSAIQVNLPLACLQQYVHGIILQKSMSIVVTLPPHTVPVLM